MPSAAAARRDLGRALVPLLVAVLAVSTAAAVFASMPEANPLALAAWRLQLTALVLVPLFVSDVRATRATMCWQKYREAGPAMAASGACLAVHFGAWVASLQTTSIAHSLLFVSTTPIIIAVVSAARAAYGAAAKRELTWLSPRVRAELAAAAVGTAGAALLAFDHGGAQKGVAPSFAGDASAALGALAMTGYVLVGGALRSWMPLGMYAMPVTAVGGVLLTLAACATHGFASAFAWVTRAEWAWKVVYLAVGPGLLGHTAFNMLLGTLSPLVITLALTLEPVVGTCVGYLAGLCDAPTALALAAGVVIVGATAAAAVVQDKGAGDVEEEGTEEQEVEAEALLETSHL